MSDCGFAVWPYDARVAEWAQAARTAILEIDTSERRHGDTWFVGVGALPNAADGSIDGVTWPHQGLSPQWHRAQVSIVYPGYPKQDTGESDAAHAYRVRRDAAHVDGLLPEGPDKRRHLREPHAFILGVPLGNVTASPLVVWEGSHVIMQSAFADAFADVPANDWGDVDVTEIYQAARRKVFDTCRRIELPAGVGQITWLHRHILHGVAPWTDQDDPSERLIAYFRPQLADVLDWL